MISKAGAIGRYSRAPPNHFASRILQSATEVSEEVSSATALICSNGFRLTSRIDRTAFSEAIATPEGLLAERGSVRAPIDPAANFPSRAMVGKKTLHLPDWSLIDLPEHERTPLDLAIPRIKFALMKPVWGEKAEGWGTPSEFETWLNSGEPDPAPPRIAQAVEYYGYGKREVKP